MHNKNIDELYDEFSSNENGISNKDAQSRLLKYGKNTLPKKKKDSFIKIFFKGLLDPIVILLVITVIFSLMVNEITDAIAIGLIILLD